MKKTCCYILDLTLLSLLITVTSCSKDVKTSSLFTRLSSDSTGIAFANNLEYDRKFNIYTYRNFYNGGGVAAGDVNNDGLPDLYFTANMLPNKLYINKGNFKFEDVSEAAGVAGERAWSTGVTMADINGDGWLDIYVCNSGDLDGDNKQNELFINQGASDDDPKSIRFSEQAEKYNLADRGYGTHAAFFDLDQDGDLDAYLLNNSYRSIFDFNRMKNQRPVRDELGGDKLFLNENSRFADISEQAGIYGSEIGFGLGVTIGDVNRDGWLDIFVSNDFFERDYLYINQGDGTFKEDLENRIQSLSVASMGADIADINNDGHPEIFVTEMLPENESRFKTKMTFENWDRYQYNLQNGYYHQFTRNVLQLNNADGTFSEIGRLAGVEATDWSWGALMADFDNDGLKDLFVANGLYKDIIDQDYINFVSNEEIVKQIVTEDSVNYKKLIDTIPSTPIPNYMFQNQGDLKFTNVAQEWGLASPSHSNGATYADLDNDGDLDLVINNVNAEAFIYRNELDLVKPRNWLKVTLIGKEKNIFAVGAQVTLYANGQTFYQANIPVRGFQSTVDPRLNFGLGQVSIIDSIIVLWPDQSITKTFNIKPNQELILQQEESQSIAWKEDAPKLTGQIFTEIGDSTLLFNHQENVFVDFDRDRLIYHMLSTQGPRICVGDVNNDGREDFFIGGAANMPSALFVQGTNGTFKSTNQDLFLREKASEDLDCIFFDADSDGDQDLYVARGGNEFLLNSNLLVDQLYINDGTGTFSRSPQYLPTFKMESTACVQAADYDQDGDQDLFVGIRVIPGYYGLPAQGYLLNNDGNGIFRDATKQLAPEMLNLGMITDALWMDLDDDNDEDLVVVGEWMPITLFFNDRGMFRKSVLELGGRKTHGWWNCLRAGDFDRDGDQDLIIGNHGLNTRFRASQEKPVELFVNDFDKNGTPEPIITQYNGEQSYPLALRHDLVMQLPHLKKKYQLYANYREQTINDIFPEESVKTSVHQAAYELRTIYLENKGKGKFREHSLPTEVQFSPVYGLLVHDFDGDDHLDLLLGGNLYEVKPEVGRYDASQGLLLKGDGKHHFKAVHGRESGFQSQGQIRDLALIHIAGKPKVLVARNKASLQIYAF